MCYNVYKEVVYRSTTFRFELRARFRFLILSQLESYQLLNTRVVTWLVIKEHSNNLTYLNPTTINETLDLQSKENFINI